MSLFSSDDSAIRCVRLGLWMRSCFHIMGPVEQNQKRRMFRRVRQVAADVSGSDVCDCIVLLVVVRKCMHPATQKCIGIVCVYVCD